MAQLLANELLIMTFKELLNVTSFGYMNSICIVCKRWKELIKLVLIEEIEFRLKTKLLIKYGGNCSTKRISYDFSTSTYNILINDNNFEVDYPYFFNIFESIEKREMCINFKYENNKEFLVEFNLGTLLFYREKNSDEILEVKYDIEWNYEDCMCISTKKDSQYDYFEIIISIEKLIISLRIMGVILDLLDEKLNNNDQNKYITRYNSTIFEDICSLVF